MEYHYCVRITRSFETLKQLVLTWAERCKKVAVYEHKGSITEKVHCHMVLGGCEVGKKQLKNLMKIHNIETGGELGGNKDWSFKDWDGDENACAYMTKGYIEPSYLKEWDMEDHERWRKMWRGGPQNTADQDAYADCFDEDLFGIEYERWKRDDREDERLQLITENGVDDAEFRFIRRWARNYVFNHNRQIWNIQAINRYKMLVYSYCFRNGIMIPKDAVFKQF